MRSHSICVKVRFKFRCTGGPIIMLILKLVFSVRCFIPRLFVKSDVGFDPRIGHAAEQGIFLDLQLLFRVKTNL